MNPSLKLLVIIYLDKEGEIDRGKLGRLVFADPEALTQLGKHRSSPGGTGG